MKSGINWRTVQLFDLIKRSVAKLFNSSKQADTTQEILIPTVGPKGIEGGPHEDGGVEARLIGLFQPPHRLVMIA